MTLAADVLYETWDKSVLIQIVLRTVSLQRRFIQIIRIVIFRSGKIRAGAHYSNSYLMINNTDDAAYKGNGYNEYGVSVGFGLPLVDNRSLVNVSFEYTKINLSGKT